MLAAEVPSRTEGRYQIERIIGFDMLEAALGKERADGGEVALLKGAQSGELDLVIVSYAIGDYVPEANVFLLPFLFGGLRPCAGGARRTDRSGHPGQVAAARVWSVSLGPRPASAT